METRETTILETPIRKAKIEVLTYITGGEQQRVFGKAQEQMIIRAKNTGNQDKTTEVDIPIGNMQTLQTNGYIELIVKKFNNSEESILQKVLDLPLSDFNFVADKLNEIIVGGQLDSKKK